MTPEEIQTILIKHRAWLNNEREGSRADLSDAVLRGADLRDAVLSDAVLRGADLRDAVLSGAYLRGAVLRGADLSGADLRDAVLRGADLSDAVLSDAVLSGADLSDAVLSGAYLRGADLRDAVLSGAYLRGADLSGADLSDVQIPIVHNLDAAIVAIVDSGSGLLDMGAWHDAECETTHCLAGWSIHLAGKPGYALERKVGSCAAGALIYHASTGRIPDFYATTDEALNDIRKCASAVPSTSPAKP